MCVLMAVRTTLVAIIVVPLLKSVYSPVKSEKTCLVSSANATVVALSVAT
jgi:hypothetical protein